MRQLSIVMPYYDNPQMLRLHQETWATYPDEVRERLRVVIVDDGSPREPAASHLLPAAGYALELYRVKENIPWHQDGARNLGMDRVPEGWCLMTDIDHLLTASCARRLWAAELDEGCYYVPDRCLAPDDVPTRPHPNSFVLERATFWRVGGAYEEFAGLYGTDEPFRLRLDAMATRRALPDVRLRVYNVGGEDVGGITAAGTRDWGRKGTRWHASRDRAVKLALREAHLRPAAKVCDFEWERVL